MKKNRVLVVFDSNFDINSYKKQISNVCVEVVMIEGKLLWLNPALLETHHPRMVFTY